PSPTAAFGNQADPARRAAAAVLFSKPGPLSRKRTAVRAERGGHAQGRRRLRHGTGRAATADGAAGRIDHARYRLPLPPAAEARPLGTVAGHHLFSYLAAGGRDLRR